MPSDKDILRQKFSSEADKYYRVALFDELGFIRKKCPSCQGYYWTLDEKRMTCPQQPCQNYEFIGNSPTSEKFDYISCWKKVESFFTKNGHHPLPRYPVVCRWRPDLYFTVASIVDFQRIESGKVVFELPANPLIIPQMCLRFVDIANVGVTGRHYTSFCMIGQTAIANENGYWKDRCIELDFNLMNKEFGIPKEEIVFREDVWLGPGAFGNSLEFFVRGLELGNAVFTGFEGTPTSYKEYREKVIDMGAGLERLSWLTQGTSNSYEAVFPDVLTQLRSSLGRELEDSELMRRYFELAGSLDIDQFTGGDYESIARKLRISTAELKEKIAFSQALYSVVDHTRTLVFAIADGALPSNVGGGYNLRVILRRSLDFLADLGATVKLGDVAGWHTDHLRAMFPELAEHRDDISTILEVEEKKYEASKSRTSKIVESIAKKKAPISTEKLAQLYDSEGITPEALTRAGVDIVVPPDFYVRITERHMADKHEEAESVSFDVAGIPPTEMLFYLNRDQFEFRGRVLRILMDDYVVLDRTAFYARSGGQEPDRGTINGLRVSDVIKFNNVVLHKVEDLKSGKIREGEYIEGRVDSQRRELIMRHHTATHIVNGACRKLIGPWVWQHSAYKDVDMGRLDITHFAHLTREQVLEIERLANDVVRRNLPIAIKWIPRAEAEKAYGFRLYQGGVVPLKELRIVNIEGWDVEACGGTHCSRTGDVGLIKITKSERVQDGVERLEFVAGEAAVNYVEGQESILLDSASKLETPPDKLGASISNVKNAEEAARRSTKQLAKRLADFMVTDVPKQSETIADGIRLYVSLFEEGLESEYQISLGQRLEMEVPDLVYVALFVENNRTRIVVFVGSKARQAGVSAGRLVKELAIGMGGSGGGDDRFAQGGLPTINKKVLDVRAVLSSLIGTRK